MVNFSGKIAGIRKVFSQHLFSWVILWIFFPAIGTHATQSGQSSNRYINSIQELREHFESHVQRVKILGMALYAAYPGLFPGVNEDLLERFLNLHDQAKLNSGYPFKAKFWMSSLSDAAFIERLYPIYASHWRDWENAQKIEIETMIRELNATDSNVAKYFLETNHLLEKDGTPSPTAKGLLKIERIADVVDRNLDPVAQEEFSNSERIPLSVFLKTPLDLELADFLVEQYSELTQAFSYPVYHSKPCQIIFRIAQ